MSRLRLVRFKCPGGHFCTTKQSTCLSLSRDTLSQVVVLGLVLRTSVFTRKVDLVSEGVHRLEFSFHDGLL